MPGVRRRDGFFVAAGRLEVGPIGIHLFGAAFLLACLGFLVAATALAAHAPWLRPVLVAASLFSLAITALDWKVAFAGAIVNALVLALALFWR